MNQRKSFKLLGGYNLLLATGAIFISIMMLMGNGVFEVYPKEWLNILPFNNWGGIAIIAALIFGIGNVIAAVLSVKKELSSPSFFMGGLLLIGTIAISIILGEWFMATVQILIVSLIQLGVSTWASYSHKR